MPIRSKIDIVACGLLITILTCVVTSCAEESSQRDTTALQERKDNRGVEDFDIFFKRFSSDSAFQVSRINFPLQIDSYDLDDGQFRTSRMGSAEWGFMNFSGLDGKHIFKTHKTDTTSTLNIQMEDTGVSIDYVFRLAEGKWIMEKVVDSST